MMKVFGGILAGGIGARMAAANGLPKQFLKVGGVPVLIRTLKRFFELEELDGLVLAMHPSWKDYTTSLLAEYGLEAGRVTIIDGGATRFDSLVNLARACERLSEGDPDALLINHDCARPFVSTEILRANIAALANYDMTTTSIPTIDTVLLSADGKCSDSVPERSTVFLDQGPQTINVKHFLELVSSLSEEERLRYMEAGRLYLEKGYRVGIVEGSRNNFKLTTPFDLSFAEALLERGIIS